MKNYDFLNLSPYEFEILSRDLLQKKLDIFLESFGDGQDQGIDLRCYLGENLIVQCKRYKDYKSLFNNLKNEVAKAKKLDPKRYILTTSVSLSPDQKAKIIDLFSPYILNFSDIYGQQDLNNLLTQFPEIEKEFYKLWLSSTNILQEIVNSQIVNQSKFVKEEINEKIKVYVQNESFFEALSILNINKYAIISGIPGIGKTTLAEMIVFHLLGKGVNEFIYLSDSINNGFELYNESIKQVFLFDDFLGRNFLKNNITTNEEKRIIQFIKRIQKSSNKYLIFTTREYILNQAKQQFEDIENTNLAKCILDLSKYSTIVKAKILYNHLFINDIPFNYVEEILKQGTLIKIIKHKNYSPRIIESFTNSKIWNNTKVEEFPNEIIELFDNPYLVWKHVYENQISELSRIILDCLLIVGETIEYQQLYKQVERYVQINSSSIKSVLNNHTFKSALKESENSLIKIKKLANNSLVISYQNPSIQDFIAHYISNEKISKRLLIDSVLFLKPAFEIISNPNNKKASINKIIFDKSEMKRFQNKIIEKFDELLFSTIINNWSNLSEDDTLILKLKLLFRISESRKQYIDFIKKRFIKSIYSEDISNKSLIAFLTLFEYFHDEIKVDIPRVLINISHAFWRFEELEYLQTIKDLYPNEFEIFREENEETYNEIFAYVVEEIRDEVHEEIELYDEAIEKLEYLYTNFDFWVEEEIEIIRRKVDAMKIQEEEERWREEQEEADLFGYRNYIDYSDKEFKSVPIQRNTLPPIRPIKSEEDTIIDIFRSLK